MPQNYTTGTVSVSNGSAVVTGSGTAWELSLVTGGLFCCDGHSVPIASVESDTSLTLALDWPGTTGASKAYAIFRETAQAASAVAANDRLAEVAERLRTLSFIAFDAAGTLAQRASYDTAAKDFIYLRTDVEPFELYIKDSATAGDWAGPNAYGQGPQGIPGPIAPFAFGAPDALAPGAIPTVTNTDTATAPNLKFGIPVGEGFYWKGAYSAATAYQKDDIVRDNGSTWIAKQATTGNAPPVYPVTSNAYWELLAVKGQDGTGIGDLQAANSLSEIQNKGAARDNIVAARKSLADIAGMEPTLDLVLTSPDSILPEWFTRASTATYFDATGVVRTAAVNAPRFDHDPVTGSVRGYLPEEARTNILLNTADMGSAWSENLATKEAVSVVRGMTLIKATRKDWANESQRQNACVQQAVSTGTGTYTLSAVVRKGNQDLTHLALTLSSGAPTGKHHIVIDLNNGQITTASSFVTNPRIVPLGDGFFRVSFSVVITSSANGFVQLYSGYSSNVAGDWTEWGVTQLEIGSFATSFIPSTSAAGSRAADILSIPIGGIPFNTGEGTLRVQMRTPLGSHSSYGAVFRNTLSNLIAVGTSGTNRNARVSNASVEQAGFSKAMVFNSDVSATLTWRANDFAASFDGDAAQADASGVVPTGLTHLDIGHVLNVVQLNSHIKRVTYWARRLSSAIVEELAR